MFMKNTWLYKVQYNIEKCPNTDQKRSKSYTKSCRSAVWKPFWTEVPICITVTACNYITTIYTVNNSFFFYICILCPILRNSILIITFAVLRYCQLRCPWYEIHCICTARIPCAREGVDQCFGRRNLMYFIHFIL